ncbi:MAG TPA: hypothetical protein VEJ85_03465, partial [Thermoplasmata archaeon]|nr:hypothetical protein [Thermoplasmata archaeon]
LRTAKSPDGVLSEVTTPTEPGSDVPGESGSRVRFTLVPDEDGVTRTGVPAVVIVEVAFPGKALNAYTWSVSRTDDIGPKLDGSATRKESVPEAPGASEGADRFERRVPS